MAVRSASRGPVVEILGEPAAECPVGGHPLLGSWITEFGDWYMILDC